MSDVLNSFGSVNLSTQILGLLSRNQTHILNNLSNMDTPNYVKQETNFEDVIGSLRSPLETGLAKKMGPMPLTQKGEGKVTLEEELMNMQQNLIFYNMNIRRAGSFITSIKAVAGVGR